MNDTASDNRHDPYQYGNDRYLPVAANGHQEMAAYNPYTQQPEWLDDEIDLRRLWQIVSKYRWLIVATVAVAVVSAMIASFLMRPVYRASALIEVKPEQRVVVELDNLQQTAGNDRGYLNTQKRILASRSITATVVEETKLAGDPEFTGELKQRGIMAGLVAVKQGVVDAFSALADGLSASNSVDKPSANGSRDDPSPGDRQRQALLSRYQSKLTVSQVPNSNLIRISFDSFSPRKAAELANAHAETFIQANDQRRFSSTSSAKEFLRKQIEEAQAALEASEKAMTDFARKQNIVDVEDRSNVMETRLENLNEALTETRSKRITAQVEYRQVKDGEIEALPTDMENELVTSLRRQYIDAKAEYTEMSKIFKDNYPKMQQLKSRMQDIKATLDEQRGTVLASLKSRYERLRKEEEELAGQVSEQREKLLDLKDRAIAYNILKREWEANKQLYSGLLEKQKDVSVAAGMEVNNISIVDQAGVPSSKHTPKTERNVALAGVFGLMGGVGIAFLLAFLDNTFKSREELEQALGMPFLGIVPKADDVDIKLGKPLGLMSEYEPASAIAEASRSIRTSVLFSRPENVPKKILVTSTTSGEGKSTVATNLALVLGQNGSRVLLIEADLRRPSVGKWMSIDPIPGLTEYLQGDASDIVKATPFENVYCVPAGSQHHNPTDLLGSRRMDDYLRTLSEHFDFIIMDGPPILGLADSMILSSKSDGTLLVVKGGSTEKEAVQETVKRLRTINAPLIGSVLNYVDLTQREYGYYNSYYYGYGDQKRKKMEHQSTEPA